MSMPDPILPRGLRDNNPCNLRYDGTAWRGLDDPPHDERGFCRFVDALHGLRAAAKVLLAYDRVHGLDTVAAIVTRWAPPSENDTAAYAADVAAWMGVAADQCLDLADPDTLGDLLEAIVRQEEGQQPYGDDLIAQAVEAALAA